MREDYKPGDLSARIVFSRVMGNGPDAGKVRPALSITCQTSGLTLELELTPVQLTEMLSGSSADVPADKVTGFKHIQRWGKYAISQARYIDTSPRDYAHKGDPRELPHLAPVIADMESYGWSVDTPHRNNSGKWVLFGRKYVDQP
jgi:hypothetical protein